MRITLVRTANGDYIPTVSIPGHTAIAGTPLPLTPAPIEGDLGGDYAVVAVARLVGAAFEITPLDPEAQSLNQPVITWQWSVLPKHTGTQLLQGAVELQWRPRDGGAPIRRSIWRANLTVKVGNPLFTRGEVNVMSLLTSLIGSALSVPWVVEQLQERKGKAVEAAAEPEAPAPPTDVTAKD